MEHLPCDAVEPVRREATLVISDIKRGRTNGKQAKIVEFKHFALWRAKERSQKRRSGQSSSLSILRRTSAKEHSAGMSSPARELGI